MRGRKNRTPMNAPAKRSPMLYACERYLREHGPSTILDIHRGAKLVNGKPIWKHHNYRGKLSLAMRMLKHKGFRVMEYTDNPSIGCYNGRGDYGENWKGGGTYAVWGLQE